MALTGNWEQVEGGLWGLLVGDAVGVPYEFHGEHSLPRREEIDMVPPKDFPRSYAHIELGTWSDDGAQALCLAASLVESEEWDPVDFAGRLLRWHKRGYMAVDGLVFDVGVQTGAAIRRMLAGESPLVAGLAGERNNGNGSLMRCLPIALLSGVRDEELVRIAHEQSTLTHRHPRSQVCCSLYCLWARREMQRSQHPWRDAVDSLRSILADDAPRLEELEKVVLPAAEMEPHGSGYVVDALHSARVACEEKSYAEIVRKAVSFGNDTDTTACIAGGIAGIRHGVEGIPMEWRERLRGKALFFPLLARVQMRMGRV
jgi:ADP-ribosyl-[dinitrogen reductase] hydrolase